MKNDRNHNNNSAFPKIIYLLESVDIEKQLGVLLLKEDIPYKRWKKIKVSLSPLLSHRIKNKKYDGLKKGDKLVGTPFKCYLHSSNFYECPFTLVEFVQGKTSDIPHNFRLQLVFEGPPQKVERLDAFYF